MRYFNTKKISWLFLIAAILMEVIGTSFLKMDINIFISHISMIIFIALAYYFMGLAIKNIQVGIAYAIWELLGSVLIICMSYFIFKEELTLSQFIGIVLAIIGIALINIGERVE